MKITQFFENTKLLKEIFDITPLLYGSLGLEYITGESLNADDIDILIPEIFLAERWTDFKKVLINNGYVLTDEKEHTFEKNNVHYSYASIEELESFADIKQSDIECKKSDDVTFKLLSLKQYLMVYTASSKDGYRINIRKKKDNEKIRFIKKYLHCKMY